MLGRRGLGVYDNFHLIGGTPVQAARLCQLMEERHGGFMHPQLLIQRPTVRHLANYLLELDQPGQLPPRKPVAEWRVGRDSLFNHEPDPPSVPMDQPLALILCAPRSGSTLLRIMLGGHPELFAPPELDLLLFRDMAERKRTSIGGWYDLLGLERTVMELWQVDAEAAREMVDTTCAENWPVQKVYGWLGKRAGRLLVDKTPAYSMHRRCLQRCENWFRRPRYIHLVRHPLPVIRSWKSFRLDHVMAGPPGETAEMMWLLCNETILDFLETVEPERHCRVVYEELVRNPRREMEKVAAMLGVDFHPALLTPI